MATKCAVASPFDTSSARTVMSGYPGYPQGHPLHSPGADSFTNQLLVGAWTQEQRPEQTAAHLSSRSKATAGSNVCDTQLRRDIDYSGGGGLTLSHAAVEQLRQPYAGSSGAGSDTAGSLHQEAYPDDEQKPTKRGRGRQRKNTGVETAQQRAHRRFYERKKQRMAALEEEAREKQEEYRQLLAINIDLRRKQEALERAVAGHDEHLLLIQALGSLSLEARGRQQELLQHQQGQPEQPAQGQSQQAPQQQQQVPPAERHQSTPTVTQHACAGAGSSSGTQLDDIQGSGSAPTATAWQQQQQQPPADLMPQLEEAGPFGMVQLPQYGSADVDALPVPPRLSPSPAGLPGASHTQLYEQEQQQQEPPGVMSWISQVLDFPPELPLRPQQWPGGGFLDLLEGGDMSLTRSLSMPARTGAPSVEPLGAQQTPEGFGTSYQGLAMPSYPSRSFSTTPTIGLGRPGPLTATARDLPPAAAAAAGEAGAHHTGLNASPGQALAGDAPGQQQQQQQHLAPAYGSRYHSWSGACTGGELTQQASLSLGVGPSPTPQQPTNLQQVPAAQQQQDLRQGPAARAQQPQQQQHSMWAAVTTTGPLVTQTPRAQQLQPPAFTGFPRGPQLLWPPQEQLQDQQGGLSTGPPTQQQQQRRGVGAQHPAGPQQVVQQLQQMGDLAFSSGAAAVALGTVDMPDDVLLFDGDMMDLLMERMSQQQSVEMLSPLPSIPSALLTGDSLRHAMMDPSLAASLAAHQPPLSSHPLTAAGPGAAHHGQQQQQQPGTPEVPGWHPETAAAAVGGGSSSSRQSSPGSSVSLLEASKQLQARHVAAGFHPARSSNEMLYVHEVVGWYKAKLQQLQQLLPFVDCPQPDVACGVNLVQTMEEVIEGVRKFGTRNRIGMWELRLINLETGECEEAPAKHWSMVAERTQLPPQMRESAMACYSLYLEYVEKVKADRLSVLQDFEALERQVEAATAANISDDQPYGAPRSLQFRIDAYEQYQQLIERLQLSLKREHMVANMLSYSLSQISSHVQMAKGMLACWPYWPDGPSVLSHWLEEEHTQQQHGGSHGGAAVGLMSPPMAMTAAAGGTPASI